MGLFSWLTADTEESIPCVYSNRLPFIVHMVTEDGQIFTEKEYDGYGNFGGKDFYVLAAELNGLKGKDDEETRNLFFDDIWKRGVQTKDGTTKLFYRKDFDTYESKIVVGELLVTPNELTSRCDWVSFDYGSDGFHNHGFKMPKLVKNLPNKNIDWKVWFNNLPYNESCPDQGYFYSNDDDDDED